jgi:5'-nucleotidase
VRGGGDGYKTFATNAVNPYDFGPNLEQAVADYLTANNPYKPFTDGRITDLTPADYTPPAKEAPAASSSAAAPAAPAPAAPSSGQTAAAPATQAPAPATPAPAVGGPKTYTVARGDSLWKIAEAEYGDGNQWTRIAEANSLRNPNRILVGAELELPAQ